MKITKNLKYLLVKLKIETLEYKTQIEQIESQYFNNNIISFEDKLLIRYLQGKIDNSKDYIYIIENY